jgi:Glyoxalase-like domain
MVGVRLRQAVLVAAELEPVAERLRAELELGEPFADPGVAEFGLRNAVFALGDTFLEVVSPQHPGAAAARHLARRGGDCGYMVIFQLDDLDAARERVERLGVRVVWRIDLPDMSGTHLHPDDVPGAIVSLDRPLPSESWRWGGPDWTGRAGAGAPGWISGVTIAVRDPDAAAARWGEVLGVEPDGHGLELDGGRVVFVADPEQAGLTKVALTLPSHVRRERDALEIGGVRFTLEDET